MAYASLVLGVIALVVGIVGILKDVAVIDPARRWLLLVFGIALVIFSLIKMR